MIQINYALQLLQVKNKALLNKELFHRCLSKISTVAIEHLVRGKPSKAMNHVLYHIYHLKI